MTDRLAEIRNRIMYYDVAYLDAIAADVVYMVARIERAEIALARCTLSHPDEHSAAWADAEARKYFAELEAERVKDKG